MATYLYRTQGTPTSTQKFTFSCWIKNSAYTGNLQGFLSFKNGWYDDSGLALVLEATGVINAHGNGANNNRTTRFFRDPGAWMHLVFAADTTQATQADRMKIYINGVQESYDTSNLPGQNVAWTGIANGERVQVGNGANSAYPFFGGMSHVHFCDGQQLAPTVFGSTDSTTGEWKINTAPSFTPGNNGFTILKDGNTITDQSANSNDFTLVGTLTKTEDCPDNNFATLNTLVGDVAGGYTIINGNLSITANTGDAWRSMYGTLGNTTGKYYWEVKMVGMNNTNGTASCQMHGIADLENMLNTNGEAGDGANGYVWRNHGGYKTGGVGQTGTYGTYVPNDILMFAMDLDNSKLYFGKNGNWEASGNPASGSTGTGALSITAGQTYTSVFETKYTADNIAINFGNGFFGTTAVATNSGNGYAGAEGKSIFNYQPPTGYSALSTKGLNT